MQVVETANRSPRDGHAVQVLALARIVAIARRQAGQAASSPQKLVQGSMSVWHSFPGFVRRFAAARIYLFLLLLTEEKAFCSLSQSRFAVVASMNWPPAVRGRLPVWVDGPVWLCSAQRTLPVLCSDYAPSALTMLALRSSSSSAVKLSTRVRAGRRLFWPAKVACVRANGRTRRQTRQISNVD